MHFALSFINYLLWCAPTSFGGGGGNRFLLVALSRLESFQRFQNLCRWFTLKADAAVSSNSASESSPLDFLSRQFSPMGDFTDCAALPFASDHSLLVLTWHYQTLLLLSIVIEKCFTCFTQDINADSIAQSEPVASRSASKESESVLSGISKLTENRTRSKDTRHEGGQEHFEIPQTFETLEVQQIGVICSI